MSQLFGMDNILSSLSGKYDNKVNKGADKVGNAKSTIGKPELSETASKYYEELKAKYGDMEFILVDDDQIGTAKEQASNIHSDKSMIVLISESELEEMATNEETRAKNEKLLEDAQAQMPNILKQLDEAGVSAKSFGIEIKDGAVSYFAVLDKFAEAQKERIEENQEEKRKEDLVTVSAGSVEELIKKLQDVTYEAMSDKAQTEQEKMVGQSIDFLV